MKTKIRLLKEFQKQQPGYECIVEDEGAKQLVANGTAEIVVEGIELEDFQKSQEAATQKAVKEAIAAEMKVLGTSFTQEEKAEMPYAPDLFGLGQFFLDTKEFSSTGKRTDSVILQEKILQEKAPAGNNTLINTEGGFLVPEEFSTILMNQIQGQAVIAPRTMNIPINSRIKLPYLRDDDKSASWAAGVDVTWGNEGSTLVNSKFDVNQVELALKKMHALVTTTDELMDDSAVALGTVLSTLTSIALSKEFDHQIVNGIGGARPLGILNSPALLSQAKVSSQTALTINTTNVTEMWKQMANPGNAVWLINRDALTQIYKLNLAVGTAGGANVFMFNIAERQSETIFGAPIIWTEHAQTVGTKGDIICADLSAYLTATKAGAAAIKSSSSLHVRFLTDEQVFKFTMRVDGQPWWPAPQTQKNGTHKISPFVSLDTRA